MPKKLIFILILGFSLRLLFFLFNRNYTYTYYSQKEVPEEEQYFKEMIPPFDSQEFLVLAKNLLTKHKFTWAEKPNTFRTPLYPIFIALFGVNIPVFIFFQILLGTIAIFFVFCIGQRLFGEKAGLIAALFLAIDIPNILFNSLVMSETLLVFFLTLGTFLLFRNRFWLSGITFSLAALTKPVTLFISVPISIFLLFNKGSKQTIIFILCFSILPLFWMFRNYRYYKVFAFTSIEGYNFLYYNLAALESNIDRSPFYLAKEKVWQEVKDRLTSDNPLYLSSIAKGYALKKIVKHLGRYSLIHLIGMFRPLIGIKSDDLILRLVRFQERDGRIRNSLSDTALSPFLKGIIFLLSLWEVVIIIGAFVLFILSLFRSPTRAFLIILFILALYFFFVSSPLPDGRFRVPSIFLIYLGGASIFQTQNKKPKG